MQAVMTPDTITIPETVLRIPPVCEARLDAKYRCHEQATVQVRFKSHGCKRDGRWVLLCPGCRDFVAGGKAGCGECDGPLQIVASEAL